MSKTKYLVEDHPDLHYYLQTHDPKEVEVLDDKAVDNVFFKFCDDPIDFELSDYLKANKYLIVKIVE